MVVTNVVVSSGVVVGSTVVVVSTVVVGSIVELKECPQPDVCMDENIGIQLHSPDIGRSHQ